MLKFKNVNFYIYIFLLNYATYTKVKGFYL